MTNRTTDTEIAAAVAKLRDATEVPPVDPQREQALLAAFDAHWAQPRPAGRRVVWVWTAAAASAVLALTVGQFVAPDGPARAPATLSATVDVAGFVPWPGAHALPPFESGELWRVDLPRTALPTLGLSAPPSSLGFVQADVVIGQDGLARAVRLVHQQQE